MLKRKRERERGRQLQPFQENAMRGRVIEAQCLLLTYHSVPPPRFRAAVTFSLATHFSNIFLRHLQNTTSLYLTLPWANRLISGAHGGLIQFLGRCHSCTMNIFRKTLIGESFTLCALESCYSAAQRSKVTQMQTGKHHISQPATGTCIFLHSKRFSLVTYLHPAYLHTQ